MEISDEMVEPAAKAIFEHWQFQADAASNVAWVPGGNSQKQGESRNYARAALEAVAPAIRAQVMEEAAKIAEEHSWGRDIDWWRNATKKSVSAETALECAAAIRAAKETA